MSDFNFQENLCLAAEWLTRLKGPIRGGGDSIGITRRKGGSAASHKFNRLYPVGYTSTKSIKKRDMRANREYAIGFFYERKTTIKYLNQSENMAY